MTDTSVVHYDTWHGGPERPTITCVAKDRQPWNRGDDWCLWIPPTGPECYEGGDVKHGALLSPYGDSFWPTQEDACEFLEQYLADQQETRVEIPVQFIAYYQAGKITRMVVLPWESFAGYFGDSSEVLSGNAELDVKDTTGPFWRAIQEALAVGVPAIAWEE